MNTDSGRKNRKIIWICAAIALAALLAVCCILVPAHRGENVGIPEESPALNAGPSPAESAAPSESPEASESPESDGINHLPFAFVDATEGNMLTELVLPLEITGETEYVGLTLNGYRWWDGPYLEVGISNLHPNKLLEVLPGEIEYLTDDGWVEVDYAEQYRYHRVITTAINGRRTREPSPHDTDIGRVWADFSVDSGKSYKYVLDMPYTVPGTYRITWTYWFGYLYSDPPYEWYTFSTMIEIPDIPDEYAASQCLIFGNIRQNIYHGVSSEGQEGNVPEDRSAISLELLFPDGSDKYKLIEDSLRLEEIYPDGSTRLVSKESGEVDIFPGSWQGTIEGPSGGFASLVPEDSYVPYIYEFGITFNERQEDGSTYFCTVDFTDDPASLTPAFTVSFKVEF